jgi:hypothetical protein
MPNLMGRPGMACGHVLACPQQRRADDEMQRGHAYPGLHRGSGCDPKDLSYLKRYKMLGTLAAEVKESVAQLEAVKQADREWADRNKIPLEVFSEPVAILNLGEEAGSLTADEETLITMRELFDGVLLTW